jgi:hypothetical protein
MGFGGMGFGGPGFGPGGMQVSSLMLLGIPAVQQELGLSETQKSDLNDLQQKTQEQVRASFGDFGQMQDLSPEERDKRFAAAAKKVEETNRQADEKAAKILNAKQAERLGQLRLQRDGPAALARPEIAKQLGLTDEQQAKIKGPQGGFRLQADVLAALTAEQKAKWAEMKGKEFQFPQPQGPGFGPDGPGFGPGGPGPAGAASAGAGGLAAVKSQIRASDEEWKIIEPKLRKVIAARQAVETGMNAGEGGNNSGRRGGFGGPGGRGGRGGPGGPGFGGDSFAGPSDSAGGGFGPGGFGPGGFGRGGFGPNEFGSPGSRPGQPAAQEGSRRDGANTTPSRSGPGRSDTARTPDNSGKNGTSPAAPRPTATTAPVSARGSAGGPGGPASGQGGPGGGPGGPGGGGGRDSAITQAMADLRTAAADPKTSAEVLKQKVAAVRIARQKAKDKLAAAKKELLELLAPDQEAVLVGLGYLD